MRMNVLKAKKNFALALPLLLALALSSCVNDVNVDNVVGSGYVFPESTKIEKTFVSRLYGSNGESCGKITTFYLDGWEDIPFLRLYDVGKILNEINGRGWQCSSVEGQEGLYKYMYYQEEADSGYQKAEWKDDTLYFDVKNQSVYSDDFTRIVSFTTSINNNIGGIYYNSVSNASYDFPKIVESSSTAYAKQKERTTINLKDYGLKMFVMDASDFNFSNEELLIPFQVLADTLFRFSHCSFNGLDYYLYISSNPDDNAVIRAYDSGRDPSPVRSRLKAEYNYRTLCLLFDLNYCIKGQRLAVGKDNIGAFINDSIFAKGLGFDLVSTDTATYDRALAKFLMNYIDDGHTSYKEPSMYQSFDSISTYKSLAKDYCGPRAKKLDAVSDDLTARRKAAGGKEGVFYVQDGGTEKMAVIAFDQFSGSNANGESDMEKLASLNTYVFLKNAFDDIKNNHNNVKNVVIDLSCNGGGVIMECMLSLCFLENPNNFYLAEKNHLDNSVVKYYCGIETKGGEVSVKQNYNFYVLTSGYSFSCGNFFPAICKYQLGVPIVGQQSGGGGGVVKNTQTSDGALFQTSASAEMCALDASGNYISIDAGVPVDLEISYDDFFSGDAIYKNLYGKLKEKYPAKF